MSAEDTHHDEGNYLNASSGFKSWFWTVDHKRLGIMYLATILSFFLIGGSFAMLASLKYQNLWMVVAIHQYLPFPPFLSSTHHDQSSLDVIAHH